MKRIRLLQEIMDDSLERSEFAFDFVGDYFPKRRPHDGEWQLADVHWLDFNSRVLRTDVIPQDATNRQALSIAETFSVNVLWVLVLLMHCPNCPWSAQLEPKFVEHVFREAKDDV